MTPQRLVECLGAIRWKVETLAEAMDVPVEAASNWTSGTGRIPTKVASWLEALCFVHEAAELTKPATSGEGFSSRDRREHVPVYAYNLLRNLNQAPILLRTLYGSEDDGAVFFLVSRGFATREHLHLVITDTGRTVGSVP